MGATNEIEVCNVTKTYNSDLFEPASTSLSNASLSFQKGVCTGIMGHNGAGKTTTIRIILGLIKPDQGTVLFRGAPIAARDRASIGYMPEADKTRRNLTPFEILSYQLRLYKKIPKEEAAEKVHQTLGQVGLEHAANKLAKHLSKGMGRRLSWAQATIHDPEIIILDEPTSGMDPLARLQMRSWIQEQTSKGKTLILCTHELEAMFDYCEQFYILRNGSVVYESSDNEKSLQWDKQPQCVSIDFAKEKLEKYAKDKNLPHWMRLETLGQKSILTLKDMGEVQKWLAALCSDNISIAAIKPSLGVEDNQLKDFFKGGDQ